MSKLRDRPRRGSASSRPRSIRCRSPTTPRPPSMGRGALQCGSTSAGTRVDLVTCHLKSKLLSFPAAGSRRATRGARELRRLRADRRAAEAATVRVPANALLEGHGDAAVVVLGDLNDEPLAATTQILLGPAGSEIGTGGFDQPDQGDPRRLWNLASLIPEEQRFSRGSGAPRADRPHPRQPCARPTRAGRRHGSASRPRSTSSREPARRAGVRPPAGRRALRSR